MANGSGARFEQQIVLTWKVRGVSLEVRQCALNLYCCKCSEFSQHFEACQAFLGGFPEIQQSGSIKA